MIIGEVFFYYRWFFLLSSYFKLQCILVNFLTNLVWTKSWCMVELFFFHFFIFFITKIFILLIFVLFFLFFPFYYHINWPLSIWCTIKCIIYQLKILHRPHQIHVNVIMTIHLQFLRIFIHFQTKCLLCLQVTQFSPFRFHKVMTVMSFVTYLQMIHRHFQPFRLPVMT